MNLLFLRLPRHRVTCDRIPLAVLKLGLRLFGRRFLLESHVTSYRLRFAIQKESRSALFLYACFEAGIAFNGRTFFDMQKRLLSTLLQPKPPAFLVAMARLIV